MRRQSLRRWFVLIGMLATVGLIVVMAAPIVAQSGAAFATNTPSGAALPMTPLFSTNTPVGAVPMLDFATNTPVGGIPSPTPQPTATPLGPMAPLFNYSLRMWLEQDLIDLAYYQIVQVQNDVRDAGIALQLTLYEMERRFSGAPHDPAQRQRLIEAMLLAPVGSIDMRSMVRPLVETAINQQPGSTEINIAGFVVTMTPANLDNRGQADTIVHIQYALDDSTLLYDDYVLALAQDGSGYTFVPTAYDLYAAPFGGIERVVVYHIGDVNRDGGDELVLRVADGQINERLYILAYRNGQAIELVRPGDQLRFGEIAAWPIDNPDAADPVLTIHLLRADSTSPGWPCVSAQEFDWTYDRNFYRPSTGLNSRFEERPSLGCALHAAEPLFSLESAEAASIIETALLEYGLDAPGSDRALMTLAMFYVMQGRLDEARATAQSLIDAHEAGTWVVQQASALIEALGISSNTALDICEALSVASIAPACEMDAVLGRYLAALDLAADSDLTEQLEALGLPVLERVRVTALGRADREVISFNLAGTNWWGFYQQPNGSYAVEPASAPEGFGEAALPQAQAAVPQAAFDALFVDDNPASALAIIASLEAQNPGLPFRPAGSYLRALSHDLTASREDARTGYYDVWSRYPDTVWGELASSHLQQR